MVATKNSVYAVINQKPSVVATDNLRNEAGTLCLEIGMLAVPNVTLQRWAVQAMASNLRFP